MGPERPLDAVVHIDTIHGDHLTQMAKPRPEPAGGLIDPLAAAPTVPGAEPVNPHQRLNAPAEGLGTRTAVSFKTTKSDAEALLLTPMTVERLPLSPVLDKLTRGQAPLGLVQ